MASKRNSIIGYENLIPGAFYRGVQPGTFCDVSTGLEIRGPKMRIADPINNPGDRDILGIGTEPGDLPEPVQMYHVRLVDEPTSKSGKKEVAFDYFDTEHPKIHEAIDMALSTGIIEHVSDEDMQEHYPETWANRLEKKVFDSVHKVQRPIKDMYAEALANRKAVRAKADAAIAAANTAKGDALTPSSPPTPPTPPNLL